jgi:hypothetical protein
MDITPALATELDMILTMDLRKDGRLGLPKRYLSGDHDLPYMPRKHKPEYKEIAEKSRVNWLPLVVDEFTKGLALDGFRAAKASDNADCWAYWQANGLDARQTVVYRGTFGFGASYVLVLPGKDKKRPVIRPLSPLRSAAWYLDDDDEFPEVGLIRGATFREGQTRRQEVQLVDDTRVITYSRPIAGGDMRWERTEFHGLGVTPMVRFRDRVDGEATGLVRPFKVHQDRINDVAFSIAMANQYAVFRQRWATGLAVPEDDDGNPVEPFQAAIDRLWVTDSDQARFGDFAQTDISGLQAEYKSAVASLAAAAQISPSVLTGDLVNVGADALLSLKTGQNRKLDEYKLLFGESWEQVFSLASRAAGVPEPASDAEVRWKDTSGQQMAAAVDALGKLSQMLGVPQEALWEDVPGMTDQKVQRWKAAVKADGLAALTAEIARQTAPLPTTQATPPAPVPVAPTAPVGA